MNIRRRKHWGWGFEDEWPSPDQLHQTAAGLAAHLGVELHELEQPRPLNQVQLRAPRVAPPASLAHLCEDDDYARASHALGKSYTDLVSGFRGRFDDPPDFVVRPRNDGDVERVLEWCSSERIAAIPYGGGTSVVGGVSPRVSGAYNGAISIDLSALERVLEVDPVSRAARIQAGVAGPSLEAQLHEHGMTLRHYPQSFELSTLGGWIATRAAGHFATLRTHIEDFVESARAITPAGVWESRRLPGSGAGVSPDRLLAGSEGTLGVITEAWVRVQPRARQRCSQAVAFETFQAGVECVREISQADLYPANCRLIDAEEARMTLTGDGSQALLVLAFESTDHAVDGAMARALEICAEHGGRTSPASGGSSSEGAVGSWRAAFLRAPYLRDVFVAMGVLVETFETAITWERFEALHARAREAAMGAARADGGSQARVTCRLTHLYPDGPAPYFTVVCPARRGAEAEQWAAIKGAVSDAVLAEGGTITHHHAVGRDHRPWYDRQRPQPYAMALRGAKAALDPSGILNPGVLIDPLT